MLMLTKLSADHRTMSFASERKNILPSSYIAS